MKNKSSPPSRHAEEVLERLRPIDDLFMRVCVQSYPECVQSMLRIIMDMPNLVVTEAASQHVLDNVGKHSLKLDVFARDDHDRLINIEAQVISGGSSDASPRRARFHQALMDARHHPEHIPFKTLPENWVIFIVDKDVLGYGLPIYMVERIITSNGKSFGDGTRIIYVNCSVQDDTPLGCLAHDMMCREPSQMRSQEWGRWMQSLKFGERKSQMCEVVDQYIREHETELSVEARERGHAEGHAAGHAEGRAEGLAEGLRVAARRMLAAGSMSVEAVARMLGLDEAEVRGLVARGSAT